MKKLIIAAGVLASAISYAQTGNVGINTSNPATTLDVVGLPTTATKADGIIAPRLTGDQLRAKNNVYNAEQTGALVYATAADTAPAGKTVNVTSAGYYYFDGAVWVKAAGGSGATLPTGPANGNFWGLTGNTGTNPPTNYLGTNDAQPLMFKVNNVQSGYTSALNGNFGGNVAFGVGALPNARAIELAGTNPGQGFRQNIAIGDASMSGINPTVSMVQNIAIGDRTMQSLVTGGTNIAIGNKAMQLATNAGSSIAIGVNALQRLNDAADGWGNIAMGYRVAENMMTGRSNVFLKNFSAITNQGDNFQNGSHNIFIGQDSGYGVLNGSNNIAIGHGTALPDGSNRFNLANTMFGTDFTTANAKLGMLTSATALPTENFDVNGTARVRNLPAANGLIYTNNTSAAGSATKDQAFVPANTVVADKNGVLGIVAGLPGTGAATPEGTFTRNIRRDNRTTVVVDQLQDGTTATRDYYIHMTGNPTAITMPAAASNTGRKICFYNPGTATAALPVGTAIGAQSAGVQASGQACYISDGTVWLPGVSF